MHDWSEYLDSICSTKEYLQWDSLYTPTDVKGEADSRELELTPLKLKVAARESRQKDYREDPRDKEREQVITLDALDGLRKYAPEHVILIGRPGSGKTTTLRRLLLEEARKAKEDPKVKIPVLVELKYYRSSIHELMRRFLKRHGLRLAKGSIEDLLSAGRFQLLLDGVNELPGEDARIDLQEFRVNNQRSTPMIFSTRDIGLHGHLGIQTTLEMQSLTELQIKDFVRKRLPDKADKMLKALTGRTKEIAKTPLFLVMLYEVFRDKEKLPDNLGSVLREFTESRYPEEKGELHLKCPDCRPMWPGMLSHLAFSMMEGDAPTELRVAVSRSEVREIFTSFLEDKKFLPAGPKAEGCISDLLSHHLITSASHADIEFIHQLLQEYYAAEHLVGIIEEISDDNLKVNYLNYLKWTEPMAMCLELLDEEDQAVRVVKLATEVDHMLAALLAGSVKSKFQDKTVSLIEALKTGAKTKIRLFGATRSGPAVHPLRAALGDENSELRIEAARALGVICSESAVEPLIEALGDEDSGVRWAAARALGAIGSESPVELLIEALGDKRWDVRSTAARALGDIGSQSAVERLIRALGDENSDVRSGAAYALGAIGSESAVEPLIKALGDEHWIVSSTAAEALGSMGAESALQPLIKALGDENSDVRWGAAHALGEIGSESALEPLIKTLGDEDWPVRSGAAYALGAIGSELAVEPLIKALWDEIRSVRRGAAYALGRTGSESALEPLIKALGDDNSDVRSAAALGLGAIGSESALEPLIEALGYEDRSERWAAAHALGAIGSESALQPLIEALGDENSLVRSAAAHALGTIGSESASEPLIKALWDQESYVRRGAAVALAKAGRPNQIGQLKAALAATDQLYVVEAIQGIQGRAKYYDHDLALKAARGLEPENKPIKKSTISIPKEFFLLHLSDLHFGAKGDGKKWKEHAQNWFSQLHQDLAGLLQDGRIDCVVISGDIAHEAIKGQYEAAEEFLKKLREEYKLASEQFLIVPGNHDVSWPAARKGYDYLSEEELPGDTDKLRCIKAGDKGFLVPKEPEYSKRFSLFGTFCKEIMGESYSPKYSKQVALREFRDKTICILGLNSAWETDHEFRKRVSINDSAISTAVDKLSKLPRDWLKIVVWHHPLDLLQKDESRRLGFLRRLNQAGCRIVLHGHAHTLENLIVPYDRLPGGGRMEVIGAGTFSGHKIPGRHPWEYNLIRISGSDVRVYTRMRKEEDGPWDPCAEWKAPGQEGPDAPLNPYYDFEI